MLAKPALTLPAFERDGFAVLKSIVSEEELNRLLEAIESSRQSQMAPGMRHLLSRCAPVRKFARSEVLSEIACSILGADAKPVRAILFDKTPASNWYVTWHQDITISVKERIDVADYGPWSIKDGIVHVQPPADILEKMVSLRVHLDACSTDNGAIKFIPGSHNVGILAAPELAWWRDNHAAISYPAERGDIIVMRPLIFHSSSTSQTPDHRRVLHIEYAGVDLPSGLEWAEA